MTHDEAVEKLRQPLDRSRIRGVSVGGGGQAPYLEGFDVIREANRIFGEDGWSYRVVGEPMFIQNPGLWYATVEVTALGVTRTDVGTNPVAGQGANSFESSIKGCVTDGLKRALRTFGGQFGNDLYDKDAEAEALRQERERRPQNERQPNPPQPRAEAPSATAQGPQPPTQPTFDNVGKLLMWARTELGFEKDAALGVLHVEKPLEITDFAGAADILLAAKRDGLLMERQP